MCGNFLYTYYGGFEMNANSHTVIGYQTSLFWHYGKISETGKRKTANFLLGKNLNLNIEVSRDYTCPYI